MNVKAYIPNGLTCGNLLFGCFGIMSAINNNLEAAAYCVWAACVFDFFDGFAARMLHVSSPIGKELDSLADMVSFGILPTMVMFSLLLSSNSYSYLPYLSFSIAIFSALRLAKFNIDERQHDTFIGVPTPANALFITSLIFLPPSIRHYTTSAEALSIITVVFSYLLVAELPLFALKFKNFSWQTNKLRFVFLGLAGLSLLFFQAGALPFIILFYVLVSLLNKTLNLA